MKIVFFGTPDFVIPVAQKLWETYNRSSANEIGIVAVVTQPPRPAGRDKRLLRSAVDEWAFRKKIPLVFEDQDIPQADLGIVAAYGRIIPESTIKKFKYGIVNIHPSLLPKYRGASPVQGALEAGETITGVTIIKMDAKMDHGPILSQFKEEIRKDDTTDLLRRRLFDRAADFLLALIPNFISGKIKPKEQDHSLATVTKIIKKEDGYINPKVLSEALNGKDAQSIERKVRAMTPWPNAWTYISTGKDTNFRLRILKSHIEDEKLLLDKVQLEGKNPVSWKQLLEGYPQASL